MQGLSSRLTRAFFARPVLDVAPELLGCTVSHAGVTVRLTEVEAYGGSNDPGSHAFRGRTPRTEVMFGEPAGLYVYFAYGMHWCANLVCGPAGAASAVLLRAGEVVDGHEVARTRRAGSVDRDLARGPARLARSLALTSDQNGIDTIARDSALVVRRPPSRGLLVRSAEPSPRSLPSSPPTPPLGQDQTVRTGPRVGVSGPGGDATAYPWRFWLDGEVTVSAYRAGTVRRPRPPLPDAAHRPSLP